MRDQRNCETLHRNMLFPLGQELQCEDKSHKVQVSEPMGNNVNTKMDSEGEESSTEEQEFKGPVTRVRARALEQAYALMAHYFGT